MSAASLPGPGPDGEQPPPVGHRPANPAAPDQRRHGRRPHRRRPRPALINLTIPAGTAYRWSSAPGDAGGRGLLDPGDTRRLAQAASQHPRTRWRRILLNPPNLAAASGGTFHPMNKSLPTPVARFLTPRSY